MKPTLVILALLLVCSAGGIRAAAPPSDPPPPASLENRDVEAWAKTYIDADAWTLITHDTEGARLTAPSRAVLRSDGLVEADVRTELFRPIEMGAGQARSGLARWSVDCTGRRYAVLSMTIFSHNNLKGELARKGSADSAWMEPNEFQKATISVICRAAAPSRSRLPTTPIAPAVPS